MRCKYLGASLDGEAVIEDQAFCIKDLRIALDGNDDKATAKILHSTGKSQRIVLALFHTPRGGRIDDIHAPTLSLRQLYKFK